MTGGYLDDVHRPKEEESPDKKTENEKAAQSQSQKNGENIYENSITSYCPYRNPLARENDLHLQRCCCLWYWNQRKIVWKKTRLQARITKTVVLKDLRSKNVNFS